MTATKTETKVNSIITSEQQKSVLNYTLATGHVITHELETFDPERAAEALVNNNHNRHMNPRNAEKYAIDMKNDDWNYDGSPIRFSDSNVLLDGQHRLRAVIISGKSVPFLVIRGLPLPAQDTMDQGRKRSVADVLYLRGESNSTVLGSITRVSVLWEQGERNFRVATTVQQQLDMLDRYPDIRSYAHQAKQISNRIGISASALGLCMWVFNNLEADDVREDADTFFRRLESVDGPAGDPVFMLARWGLKQSSKPNRLVSQEMQVAIIIKAWNRYRRGDTVPPMGYKWTRGGANPESFPEPI